MSYEYVYFPLKQEKGPDLSGVTATAGDVDEGKIFVNSTGQEVEGTSTYKADYTALHTLIGQTTAVAEDVAQGKVFVKSDGTQGTGTASGGGNEDLVKMIERRVENTNNITIPDGAVCVGEYAFYKFQYLTSVNIPASAAGSVYDYAFNECTNLTTVNFLSTTGRGVIQQYAFYQCTNLSQI